MIFIGKVICAMCKICYAISIKYQEAIMWRLCGECVHFCYKDEFSYCKHYAKYLKDVGEAKACPCFKLR